MLLLDIGLAVPEQRRLGVVIGEPFRLASDLVIAFLAGFGKRDEPAAPAWKGQPPPSEFGSVRHAAAVNRLPMHPVALVVVDLRDRRVDGDFVEVRSAQPGDLRVDVGMDPAREQRIIGEVDARHDVRDAERHLLGFGEKVVGVAIQDQPADWDDRNELFGDDVWSRRARRT